MRRTFMGDLRWSDVTPHAAFLNRRQLIAGAAALGFAYGHPEWANLGQGAPETGALPGSRRLRQDWIAMAMISNPRLAAR